MMDEWELLNTEDGLALQDAMYGISRKVMKMNAADIHLKFPNETIAMQLLLEAGLLKEVEGQFTENEGFMVDVIGLIHKPTGKILKDNMPEFADVGGWHVNVRGDLPEIIKPYKITVTGTPHRIWD